MAFHVTDRMGAVESDVPVEQMKDVLDSLDAFHDPVHPAVSLTHESDWSLAAYPNGLVVWKSLHEGKPRHIADVSRDEVLQMWQQLAAGNLDEIESQPWTEGQGSYSSPLPRQMLFGLAAVWLVVGTWLTSDGGERDSGRLLLWETAFALGLIWLVNVGVTVGRERSPAALLKPNLVAIPLLLMLGLGVQRSEAALHARFAIGQPSLERYAKSASAKKWRNTDRVRVGTFTIWETEALDEGAVRLVTSYCWDGVCGFVYSPKRVPPRVDDETYLVDEFPSRLGSEEVYVHFEDKWFFWENRL